jgi:hypothetical protein
MTSNNNDTRPDRPPDAAGHFMEKVVAHYRAIITVTVAVTAIIALLAALPTVVPLLGGPTLGGLAEIRVDTDPENMLSPSEPVRVYHNEMKQALSLYDMVVVGVVNDSDPNGVFNPSSLKKVSELTAFARKLRGDTEEGRRAGLEPGEGVVDADVIAPSTVDNIIPSQHAIGFQWMMPTPPETLEGARNVLADSQRIPLLRGTMVPEKMGDGKAVCIYLPITRKDISYNIYKALQDKVAELGGPEKYHVTGLPVAEDTFGVEMFIQMAISAPAAMAIIFVLMLVFFRKLTLVISPMIVALVSVIFTMGALIIAGFPIHIMSSMIPIFIMPIAVLDSIHIISEFYERYDPKTGRRRAVVEVMDELFMPMLYTSLTSAAGFASLALTPIPPVQVFGMFVAAGIMVAWILTVTFIPAFIMVIRPERLANFGAKRKAHARDGRPPAMERLLHYLGGATYRRSKLIIAGSLLVLAVAGYGISRIQINDNPIKWFVPTHPIRQADTVLNRYFGGTYMAYLAMQYDPAPHDEATCAAEFQAHAEARLATIAELLARLPAAADRAAQGADSYDELFSAIRASLRPDPDTATDNRQSAFAAVDEMLNRVQDDLDFATPPVDYDKTAAPATLAERAAQFDQAVRTAFGPLLERPAGGPASRDAFIAAMRERVSAEKQPDGTGDPLWQTAHAAAEFFCSEEAEADEVFKRPDVLDYMAKLQKYMGTIDDRDGEQIVGKTSSLADIVATVHRDLHAGEEKYLAVPNTVKAVGSCITQYQSSHRPQDLAHFVTRDNYRLASMWVQLRSGDNRDMSRVASAVDSYVADNPPPVPMISMWFGLTYINVVWQDKMVKGMLSAFAGSFLVVFLLMIVLFRSALWGILSMVPLTVTIAAIYGAVGLVGKDYDMPTAVLSSLTLGLAVDFAIHFLARSRSIYQRFGDWRQTAPDIFGEPARAIARNILVIAAGFLPLLLAPLVPYRTVGALMATILLVSGLATLLLLPALIRSLERALFPQRKGVVLACNCGTCVTAAVTLAALMVVSFYRYLNLSLNTMVLAAVAVVAVAIGGCAVLSRSARCRMPIDEEKDK